MIDAVKLEGRLRKSAPPWCLVLSGAEEFLRAEARRLFIARVGDDPDIVELDAGDPKGEALELQDLLDELMTGSLFSPAKVVVVRRARPLVTAHDEALAAFFAGPAPPAHLVLEDEEIVPAGKRSRARPPASVAAAEKAGALVVNCRPLRAKAYGFGRPEWDCELTHWLCARAAGTGKKLAEPVAFALHARCGGGLRGLASQLEKLVLHAGERDEIRLEDVEELVPGARETTFFEAVDELAAGRRGPALASLGRLFAQGTVNASGSRSFNDGEIAIRTVNLIATRLREIGRIVERRREGASFEEAAGEVLGKGRRWLFGRVQAQVAARTPRELGNAVVAAAQLDYDLKSGGGQPRDLMTRYFIEHTGPPPAARSNPFSREVAR